MKQPMALRILKPLKSKRKKFPLDRRIWKKKAEAHFHGLQAEQQLLPPEQVQAGIFTENVNHKPYKKKS